MRSKFGTSGIKSRLTCVGIDIPEEKEYKMPKALEKYKDDYMIYVGRVTQGKGFDELNKYFLKYKAQNASNMKLIVVGKIDNGMTITHSDDIIFAGYVTEEEKTALIKNARLLVMPSFYESLSLVILESMAVKRPVLVNGKCEVLKGQCIRSNAGLYYENYEEFEECLNYIVANKEAYEQMCENGFAFVKENYDWNLVTQNVISLIEELQE